MDNNGIIAYEVREKKLTAKSSLVFTGLVAVPPAESPEEIHEKIVRYFDNSDQIKGVEDHELKEVWDLLDKAITEKSLTANMMPTVAWDKLKARQMCSREELKTIIKREKQKEKLEKQKEKLEKQKETSATNSQAFADLKTTAKVHTMEKVTEANSSQKNPEDVMKEVQNDQLVFAFLEEDGTIGRSYHFDEKVKQDMMLEILQNPQTTAAKFFLEMGVMICPVLRSENARLRDKVSALEKTVEETKEKLQLVTMDRDERVREAMSSGSDKVNELYIAKEEKKEADLKIKSLEDQLDSMKQVYNEKNLESLEKIQKKLEEIHLTTETTKDEVLKTKEHTEKVVAFYGSDRERRTKLWTPAADKISQIQAKIVFIAKESFFRVTRSYKSLGRDMDKLINSQNLFKIVLSGGGLDMASDFHKKKNTYGGWGQDTLVVLLVDDAEIVDTSEKPETRERNLDSVANFFSSGLDAKSAKAVLLVAGPSLEEEKESGRETIMKKIGEVNPVTMVNMSVVVKEVDHSKLEKWDNDGNFTPLSAAYLMTTLASWANGVITNTEERPNICIECGFSHESNDKICFKGECMEAREKMEDETKQERKNALGNKYGSGSSRSWYDRAPRCGTCGNFHRDECRFAKGQKGAQIKKKRTKSPE